MNDTIPVLTRRDCLLGGGLLLAARSTPAPAAATASAPSATQKLDARIADPSFNTELVGRLQGDLSGRQRWIHNPGFVFATVPGQGLAPGEFGRLLYRVEGFTARISRLTDDGSVEERSHSWMFYRHAEEDRWLEKFDNPWTGETLDAPPFRGGPSHSWLRPATGPGTRWRHGTREHRDRTPDTFKLAYPRFERVAHAARRQSPALGRNRT
jgi:hypothetical protein